MVKDHRHAPDPSVRQTARVVGERVVVARDGVRERRSQAREPRRSFVLCVEEGTTKGVAPLLAATTVPLDRIGDEMCE